MFSINDPFRFRTPDADEMKNKINEHTFCIQIQTHVLLKVIRFIALAFLYSIFIFAIDFAGKIKPNEKCFFPYPNGISWWNSKLFWWWQNGIGRKEESQLVTCTKSYGTRIARIVCTIQVLETITSFSSFFFVVRIFLR